jgi:hypothetical protein
MPSSNSKKASSKEVEKEIPVSVPENFGPAMNDFLQDLSTTFPEYVFLWQQWMQPDANTEELFIYVAKVYPERFFDILYQNEEIFSLGENEVETRFLPNVDFRMLYHCKGITETTRQSIWKYLQLILVTVLKTVQNRVNFGDTANIFEGVDENALQDKLRETMEGISSFFKNMPDEPLNRGNSDSTNTDASGNNACGNNACEGEANGDANSNANAGDAFSSASMPDADELHEHLRGLFDGKIGSLAKELAEEIAKDAESMFGSGAEIRTTQDLLKRMVSNPGKMMTLMKSIGSKIQQKMKTGELSEEDIMREASEWMAKMKASGKGGDFAEMMKNMTKGMAGGGGKATFNATAFAQMEKKFAMKERMQQKLEAKKLASTPDPTRKIFHMDDSTEQEHSKPLTDVELEDLFSCKPKKTGKAEKKKPVAQTADKPVAEKPAVAQEQKPQALKTTTAQKKKK